MHIKIIIKDKPVSVNQAYANNQRGARYMTPKGKAFKHAVHWSAYYEMKKLKQKFKYPIQIQYDFHLDNRLRSDLDNFIKLLQDALSPVCFADDREIKKIIAEKHYSPGNERIEIIITQLDS